jgi:hypothetical protein
MALRALILPLALSLTGCASEPRIVNIPVPQRIEPLAELLEPVAPPVGEIFVPPGAAGAVACVAPAGRDALVDYVRRLRQRDRAWRAWAEP